MYTVPFLTEADERTEPIFPDAGYVHIGVRDVMLTLLLVVKGEVIVWPVVASVPLTLPVKFTVPNDVPAM